MRISDVGCGFYAFDKRTTEVLLAMWELRPSLFQSGYGFDACVWITLSQYKETLVRVTKRFIEGKANTKELKFLESLGFIHKINKQKVK